MQSEKLLSLEQIEQEFIHWRQNRSSPREPIPQYLWQKAVRLYPTYTTSMIRERLKLSGSQLKEQILQFEESSDFKDNPFVIAKMPEAPELPAKLPALPEAFASFTLKTSDRELRIQIPCAYLGQCFAHMGGLL